MICCNQHAYFIRRRVRFFFSYFAVVTLIKAGAFIGTNYKDGIFMSELSQKEALEPTASKVSLLPQLNELAPNFDVLTTDGRRRLADYAEKWLVLFSHPADFTPVCTTEFMAFAVNAQKFEHLNCELLGLSIDSHYAHIAWKRNIEDNFGIHIPFPIAADIDMKMAKSYGMIHNSASETTTVRAVFIIDPRSKLRAMIYYPMTNGRSVQEILRVLTAMQISDENGIATPEGWKPGDNVIVSAPVTSKAAASREQMAKADPLYQYTDWYFCERPLSTTEKSSEKPSEQEKTPADPAEVLDITKTG